eukprot:CAMPEP_0205926052 /NCGR_PEP_ID=MMETSP1325-20131115/19572_1 /ASSEMBLY_ACC=CAM_ASM_000708 /TAXON_ID=236786 /ORGANISM="Florenciella sp., Strain RCC1007" /LENGTH=64 /DNA_ID=CAMNT_0053294705 /DNA_START=23 /DNA_END=213 /DNA_ORIENTATION=+
MAAIPTATAVSVPVATCTADTTTPAAADTLPPAAPATGGHGFEVTDMVTALPTPAASGAAAAAA